MKTTFPYVIPEHDMTNFPEFRTAIDQQLTLMSTSKLFIVDIPKDDLWKAYLAAFPPGTNPIFRERTEHDCQCCKQFIRTLGPVVSIVNNQLVSIWDITTPGFYQEVANRLSALIKSYPIKKPFYHYEYRVGTYFNHAEINDSVVRFDHFHHSLSSTHVQLKDRIPTICSQQSSLKETTKRSLDEITTVAAETVLELISQNSLYRGQEHQYKVEQFLSTKRQYDILSPDLRDNFYWTAPPAAGIRSTAIGTLLTDLSGDRDLEFAVTSFEQKVAPTNYKRSSAPISASMIRKAQETLSAAGLIDSLPRRHATSTDLTINSILFADRSTKHTMNVFDEMAQETPAKSQDFSRVETISKETFIRDILPKATKIEILVENTHLPNFMSLLTATNPGAPTLFKWDNSLSWTYIGAMADSIKERVKNAGGSVFGELRFSLAWYNLDDLDIHVKEPNTRIYYGRKRSLNTKGVLDVDMNVSPDTRSPVENIVWAHQHTLDKGSYKVYVHNYTSRENTNIGFEVEVENMGKIQTYSYDKKIPGDASVPVAIFTYSPKEGVIITPQLPASNITKTQWNITTQKFHPVSMILDSPNHWNDPQGNQHLFFILAGCKNPSPVRGFFNEFLRSELTPSRKVFETLGDKMKAPYSDSQLSGLGFSSTQRNQLTCRISGAFNRAINVIF